MHPSTDAVKTPRCFSEDGPKREATKHCQCRWRAATHAVPVIKRCTRRHNTDRLTVHREMLVARVSTRKMSYQADLSRDRWAIQLTNTHQARTLSYRTVSVSEMIIKKANIAIKHSRGRRWLKTSSSDIRGKQSTN